MPDAEAAPSNPVASEMGGDKLPSDMDPVPSGVWRYLPSSKVMMCVAGIIGSLLMYALLQERIMTKPYTNASTAEDSEGEYFRNSLVLVFFNRLAASVVAAAIIIVRGDVTDLRNKAPLYKYFAVSVSNVIATSCQYEALKWVTFPTQTLAKSAKMIPVLVWGSLISGKVYGIVDYLCAVSVALGCTLFMVFGKIAAKKASDSDSYFGLLLMLGYLGFDGFTSTFQEKLFSGYSMSIYNQMMYVNFCSACMSMMFVILSGKVTESIVFFYKYPQLFADVSILSASAVSGQFAISYTIKTFGALLYATIMTIRQFLSVFISNIVFRHGMSFMQWLGATIVFGALFYKSFVKSQAKKQAGPKAEAPIESSTATDQEKTGLVISSSATK